MTNWSDSTSSRPTTQREVGSWQYLGLFAMETVGAIVLFWVGIPLYREFLSNPATHEPNADVLLWALPSIGLIQIAYWVCDHIRPPLPRYRSAFVGTVIPFFARMSFVFASSVFSVVFITQRYTVSIPILRYAVTLLGLFSLFCYVLELERLGRALRGQGN